MLGFFRALARRADKPSGPPLSHSHKRIPSVTPHIWPLIPSHTTTQHTETDTGMPSTKLNMRTFSAFLAAAAVLAPAAVLGEVTAAQELVKDVSIADILHPTESNLELAKAAEELKLRVETVNDKLCYHLTGPESGLSLLLCEDDAGARKRYDEEGVLAELAPFPATNEDTYSWVNGTIINLGEIPVCDVAFASRTTDLVTEALEMFPSNLPTTTVDEPPLEAIDLAPKESIDFAYFLPYDDAHNLPAFVGLANSLHACTEAKEKFIPDLDLDEAAEAVAGAADEVADAAGDAVDATQATTGGVLETIQGAAKDLVDNTQEKLDAAIDSLQEVLKQPEEAVTVPTDTTTTTTTEETAKPAADDAAAAAAADAKAADAAEENAETSKVADPIVAEQPTKEAQKAETTSPAGTRAASGSVLLLGMIAALSIVALFA